MKVESVRILGADGKAHPASKPMMLANGSNTPFDAADYQNNNFQDWNPHLWSPDGERNIYRDRIVSRTRDLTNNDGWASGAITRIKDNVIGGSFRPVAKPDYQAISAYTGNKAFDSAWADEFGKACDSYWRNWAADEHFYCHSQRNLNFSQMMALAFRHKLVDGDAIAIVRWLPERVGAGRAMYSTCIQIVDPDRLSNPQNNFDQQTMRGGVEVDEDDVAIAYHIRQAHAGDWFSAEKSLHWERILRETDWGRPIIVHDFETERANQHRGGSGVLTPIVNRLKMLAKYDGTALDAAIVGAMFGAYVQSPYDPQLVAEALGDTDSVNAYQQSRSEFHQDRKISLGGARMPILFPGENIGTVSANNPNENYDSFQSAFLRNMASATGLSAQQMSNNWSDVNYSSARGALLEAWKTLMPRRTNFASKFAGPIRSCWLEESMDVDEYPMPRNAPSFIECRTAFSRCMWMGPGKGVIDVTKEREGSLMAMSMGLSTLEIEAADQGLDWEEMLDQRQREVEAFKKRGLQLPEWSGIQNTGREGKGGNHDKNSPNYSPDS